MSERRKKGRLFVAKASKPAGVGNFQYQYAMAIVGYATVFMHSLRQQSLDRFV
ncbi:hypothetical protein SOASR031_27780 [Leminorella grimontii]|nr:hypothetical protein SOASR031_27780 [Leminorella grimontii]